MKTNLYIIHDRVANIYEPPIASQNDATAMRWFSQCVSQVPTMAQNPGDFAFYHAGEFDGSTGLIDAKPQLTFICTALDCIEIIQQEGAHNVQEQKTEVGNDSSVQPSSQGGNTTQ